MVRFVEEKQTNSVPCVEKARRNSAKAIDQKLKKDDAVFFLKTLPDEPPLEVPFNEPHEDEESDPEDGIEFYNHVAAELVVLVVFFFSLNSMCCLVQVVNENQKLKIPILTTDETYFTSVKEDTSHLYDVVTYKSTVLEVLFEYSVPNQFLSPVCTQQLLHF